MHYIYKKYKWFCLGLLAILIRFGLDLFPEFALEFYQNTIFKVIRIVWDNTMGLIDFPLIYLFIFLIVIYLFLQYSLTKKVLSLGKIISFILNSVGFIVFFFMIIWGFNYAVPSLAERNHIRTNKTDNAHLLAKYYSVSEDLTELRKHLPEQIITENLLDNNLEDEIRNEVKNCLQTMHYEVAGKVRCRFISKSGWMRRLGISGIYFPFVSEAHCDASQTVIPKVFTLAHELSHGYGITNEGEANFVAWLALYNSENKLYKYIAQIELMNDILVEFRNRDYENYLDKRDELSFWVKEDLNHIRQNAMLYPPLFPRFSYTMNDVYLKSQGVEKGASSYDELLNLVMAYEKLF